MADSLMLTVAHRLSDARKEFFLRIRPPRTNEVAAILMAVTALAGAGVYSFAAAPTPAPPQKLLIRYVIFTAAPMAPPKSPGGQSAPPRAAGNPASLLDLNRGIDFELGKRPEALLDLLSKETPGYRFKLLFAGSAKCMSDSICKIAGGPRRGDRLAAQIRERLSFKPLAPGVWIVQDRGAVKFIVPGSGGSERSGWSWDVVFPHVHVDHTQSIGSVTLLSGVIVVYARCLEYD